MACGPPKEMKLIAPKCRPERRSAIRLANRGAKSKDPYAAARTKQIGKAFEP